MLAKVISVEKEIQGCLEIEKTKARNWLEEVRRETEKEFAKAEERIGKALKESEEQARCEAVARAEIIVRGEGDRKTRLFNLSDDTLRRIIMGRLNMILPE